jgi:drug/metabolite transporter (DMT)-like permease
MAKNQILGAVILVAGVIILGFAFNASDAPMERVSETLTGRYSDQTMLYFLIGGIAAVGGGLLFAFGQRG